MKKPITTRKVREHEWEALQVLNKNAIEVENIQFDDDLVDNWAQSKAGQEYFKNLVSDASALCLVVEDKKKLVGYIVLRPLKFSYRKSKYVEVENL